MSSSRAKLIGPETCSLRSSDENWSHKPASRGAQQGTCIMHQRVAWTLNKRKDPFSIPLFPSAHKSGVADGVRADVTPSPLRCMAPAGLCTEDETKTGSGLKILITRQLSKTSFQLQLVNSSTNRWRGKLLSGSCAPTTTNEWPARLDRAIICSPSHPLSNDTPEWYPPLWRLFQLRPSTTQCSVHSTTNWRWMMKYFCGIFYKLNVPRATKNMKQPILIPLFVDLCTKICSLCLSHMACLMVRTQTEIRW